MMKANHSLFLYLVRAHEHTRQPEDNSLSSSTVWDPGNKLGPSPCQQAAAPPPHGHSLIPSPTHDFEPGSHSFRAKLVLNLCSPASASKGIGLYLCTIILKTSSFCVCMWRFSELIFQLAYKITGSIMVLSCMCHIWCWFITLPRSASRPTAHSPGLAQQIPPAAFSLHLLHSPSLSLSLQDFLLTRSLGLIHNLSEVSHTKKTRVLIWVWLVLLNIRISNFRHFSVNVMTLFFCVFSLFLLF